MKCRRDEELFNIVEKLYKICDVLKCSELVEIESAHISGISSRTAGEACVYFLEELVSKSLRVSVFTTCNPCGLVFEEVQNDPVQHRILSLLRSLGVSTWLTCTPYEYMRVRPRRYYAWSESSAVAYANSVCDAYVEKFPGMLAVLCAVTGLAPKIGLMARENRVPRVLVRVNMSRPLTYVEAGLLGKYLAETFGDSVLYLEGAARLFKTREHLKSFLAAYATYCNNTLVVLENVTPNYAEYRRACREHKEDVLSLGEDDIARLVREHTKSISTMQERRICVVIGCPHVAPEVAHRLVTALSTGRDSVKYLVFTSRFCDIRTRPDVRGVVRVLFDTCLFVSRYVDELSRNFDVVITNSVKQFYYLQKVLRGVEIVLSDIRVFEQVLNSV